MIELQHRFDGGRDFDRIGRVGRPRVRNWQGAHDLQAVLGGGRNCQRQTGAVLVPFVPTLPALPVP